MCEPGWWETVDMGCHLPRQLWCPSRTLSVPAPAQILTPDFYPVLGRFHSISYNRRLKRVSVGGHPPSCVAWHYLEALSCSASWHNWAHSLKIPRKDFFSFSFPKNHLNWEVGFCLCKTHQDLLLPLPTPRQSCLPCSSSQWLKTMSQAFIASLVFCC